MLDSTSRRGGRFGVSVRMLLLVLLIGILITGTVVAGVMDGRRPVERVGGADDEQSRLLVVVGPPGVAHYEITVDGSLAPANSSHAAVDAEDEVNATRARGVVAGNGADAYRITGNVTSLTLAGNATLFVDGERVAPDTLSSGWVVSFSNCSAVTLSGEFASGYVFSTVVFPVNGPDGELLGFEENPISEFVALSNAGEQFRAGSTLPTNVSNRTVVRSVFLYERPVPDDLDPILVELEVADRIGEPAVRVENAAYGSCHQRLQQRLENTTGANASMANASMGGTGGSGRNPSFGSSTQL